ncbi:hypothetical protein C8J56DRAFT_891640 [Mycena floridula]|nr:hypothetical protein C8J56DRAFT_891640 [Mycena floridula]
MAGKWRYTNWMALCRKLARTLKFIAQTTNLNNAATIIQYWDSLNFTFASRTVVVPAGGVSNLVVLYSWDSFQSANPSDSSALPCSVPSKWFPPKPSIGSKRTVSLAIPWTGINYESKTTSRSRNSGATNAKAFASVSSSTVNDFSRPDSSLRPPRSVNTSGDVEIPTLSMTARRRPPVGYISAFLGKSHAEEPQLCRESLARQLTTTVTAHFMSGSCKRSECMETREPTSCDNIRIKIHIWTPPPDLFARQGAPQEGSLK